MPVISKSYEFIENIHHIDVMQYSSPKVTSAFLYHDGKDSILFDTGTSNDIKSILNYLEKNKVPLKSILYIIPTHYHFDHGGGVWKCINYIKKYNPKVKILCTEKNKDELQNPTRHMKAAKSTYGDFIGVMNPPADNDFLIINSDTKFQLKNENYSIDLIKTPGHTDDHVSPTMYRDGEPYFCFSGEAAGTNMNETKICTLPTSMPTQFNYNQFMNSLEKLINLKPRNLGLGHFGSITGESDVIFLLKDQKKFIQEFRKFCKEKFEEKGSTRYVVEVATNKIFKPRWEYFDTAPKVFQNNILALIYGMLVDLGLKQNKY